MAAKGPREKARAARRCGGGVLMLSAIVLCAMELAGANDGVDDARATLQFAPPPGDRAYYLNPIQLNELVARFALYPDDLVALMLAAAGHPQQLAAASVYLAERPVQPELLPDPTWDQAVRALLNYPEALTVLVNDSGWTGRLAAAAALQGGEVLQAVARFRQRAHAAGALRSDAYQRVEVESGTLRIEPTDPDVIYVPRYRPARVLDPRYAHGALAYSAAYPLYYAPDTAWRNRSLSGFWGISSAFAISWSSRRVLMRDRHHHRHHARRGRHEEGSRWGARHDRHGPSLRPDYRSAVPARPRQRRGADLRRGRFADEHSAPDRVRHRARGAPQHRRTHATDVHENPRRDARPQPLGTRSGSARRHPEAAAARAADAERDGRRQDTAGRSAAPAPGLPARSRSVATKRVPATAPQRAQRPRLGRQDMPHRTMPGVARAPRAEAGRRAAGHSAPLPWFASQSRKRTVAVPARRARHADSASAGARRARQGAAGIGMFGTGRRMR